MNRADPTKPSLGAPLLPHTFWLVIQHGDVEYQDRYLEMMRTAAESGDLEKDDFVLLLDRIRVSQGKDQIYGAQVTIGDKTGKAVFFPIEDEKNVDG